MVEGEERYKWRNLDEEVLPWVDRRAACCGSEKMTAEKTKHKTEARIGEKRFCSNCVPYHGGQNDHQSAKSRFSKFYGYYCYFLPDSRCQKTSVISR